MTDTAETRWETRNEAGRRLFSQGDYAAAEQEFIAAMREANALGQDDLRLASSLASLAQIKYLQKDIEQAEALFKRALSIREKHLGEKHPEVAVIVNSLARLYFRRNDFVSAAPLLMRLLAIKQESLGAHHPEVAVILTSLAKVRLAERQYEDAEQLARRALLIREEIHKPNDPAVAMSLDTLADVLAARGLLEEEQRLRKRIADIRGASLAAVRPVEGSEPPSAPQSSAGHAAPPSGPPPSETPPARARTTRSASLPWIEPPTSPALRRPAPRPFATTGPVGASSGTPGTPAPSKIAPPVARSASPPPAGRATPRFAAQYAPPAPPRAPERPVRKATPEPVTGPVRGPLVQPIVPPREERRDQYREQRRDQYREERRDQYREERRSQYREPSRESRRQAYEGARALPRRRSPLRFVIAAALLLACAGGAWVYLTGGRVTSSAGAALDPLSAEGKDQSPGAPAANPSALTASPDPSYGNDPPQRRKPPAAAYSDDPPSNIDQLPAGGESGVDPYEAARAAARAIARDSALVPADTASPLEPHAPAMPAANVDRITSAIGDNARAKADSLGRKTITVKAPDFKKP
ncbi:MAG TPA: tetratricopeptide repeat protein [Gemmatimonadaceae bacterium]|nr:tetratricopeptide repeat protein [Gemmatimonadaceae bacterium]